MSKISLNELNTGDMAEVVTILTSGSMRRRFLDLGIIEGTIIECAYKSPYGDSAAYRIRGAVIAIRGEDSSDIMVISDKS